MRDKGAGRTSVRVSRIEHGLVEEVSRIELTGEGIARALMPSGRSWETRGGA